MATKYVSSKLSPRSNSSGTAELFLVAGVDRMKMQVFNRELCRNLASKLSLLPVGDATKHQTKKVFVAESCRRQSFPVDVLYFTPIAPSHNTGELEVLLSTVKAFFPFQSVKLCCKPPYERLEAKTTQRRFLTSVLCDLKRHYLSILQVYEYYSLPLNNMPFQNLKPLTSFNKREWDNSFVIAVPKFLCLLSWLPNLGILHRSLLFLCSSVSEMNLYSHGQQRIGEKYREFFSQINYLLSGHLVNLHPCVPFGHGFTTQSEALTSTLFRRCTFNFLPFFGRTSLNNVLRVVRLMLLEKKILVVLDQPGVVAIALEILLLLILPFQWVHTLIPIVPESKLGVLGSVTPYLCGFSGRIEMILDMLSEISCDAVVVDLNSDTLYRIQDFHKKYLTATPLAKKLSMTKQCEDSIYACTEIARSVSSFGTCLGHTEKRFLEVYRDFYRLKTVEPELQIQLLCRAAMLTTCVNLFRHCKHFSEEFSVRHSNSITTQKKSERRKESGLRDASCSQPLESSLSKQDPDFVKAFLLTNSWENFMIQLQEKSISASSISQFSNLCELDMFEKELQIYIYELLYKSFTSKSETILFTTSNYSAFEPSEEYWDAAEAETVLPCIVLPGTNLGLDALLLPKAPTILDPFSHIEEQIRTDLICDIFSRMAHCLTSHFKRNSLFFIAFCDLTGYCTRKNPAAGDKGDIEKTKSSMDENFKRPVKQNVKTGPKSRSIKLRQSNRVAPEVFLPRVPCIDHRDHSELTVDGSESIYYSEAYSKIDSSSLRYFVALPSGCTIDTECWNCKLEIPIWYFLSSFRKKDLSDWTCCRCKRYLGKGFELKIKSFGNGQFGNKGTISKVSLLTLPECLLEIEKMKKPQNTFTTKQKKLKYYELICTLKMFFSIKVSRYVEESKRHYQTMLQKACLEYLASCGYYFEGNSCEKITE